MKSKSLIISTGLAMFSMFFGSGNLVFPLLVGQMSEGHYLLASIGILLTGVVVPFLGILGLLLFNGDSNAFFARMGRPATFWFPLFALSLMGPFGVLARCITVAHGAFRLLTPDLPLWIFSLIACVAIFFLTIRKNRIVPLLGSLLTPLLLASLAAIAIVSLTSHSLPTIVDGQSWASFKHGIFQGYQTMDLLAAFFFSVFVIKHLNQHPSVTANPASALPVFLRSSLIGAGLLSSIYFLLVLMGAMYAPELGQVPPQEMLGFIAERALGKWAAPMVCIAVILACLTTALVLTSLFSDFLKKEISKNRLPTTVSLAITLGIAFFISTLQFSGIMAFIAPILEFTYPALIVLTVANIFYKLWGLKIVRMPIAVAVLVKMLSAI
ncbi:MAG: branched-chain amino acid transport system II carrier protein [Verrucomicrobiota bacterium]|nr:branched-chain amino acid transport system II carrier protein [Verrucomicrobiota bacterium]